MSIAGYDMSALDQHWDVRRWLKSSDFRLDLRANKVQNFKFAYQNWFTKDGRMMPKWDVTYPN